MEFRREMAARPSWVLHKFIPYIGPHKGIGNPQRVYHPGLSNISPRAITLTAAPDDDLPTPLGRAFAPIAPARLDSNIYITNLYMKRSIL